MTTTIEKARFYGEIVTKEELTDIIADTISSLDDLRDEVSECLGDVWMHDVENAIWTVERLLEEIGEKAEYVQKAQELLENWDDEKLQPTVDFYGETWTEDELRNELAVANIDYTTYVRRLERLLLSDLLDVDDIEYDTTKNEISTLQTAIFQKSRFIREGTYLVEHVDEWENWG